MFAKKFTLVIVILVCVFSAGGQQPPSGEVGQVEKIVTATGTGSARLDQKLAFLAANIDIHNQLIKELRDQTGEGRSDTARYQIAATTIQVDTGLSFTQVFRVDTRTGNVCQVVGPKSANGELIGTSLPYCTQK